MRRREFLATGCAAIGAGVTGFDPRPSTFDLPPAGLQLYSLRTEMKRDLEGTLRRLVER